MKRLLLSIAIIAPFLLITSCTATKEAGISGEARKQKELMNQALVKDAIETRRFIVKFERLYLTGGMVELKPRANYLIVDGDKAIISATYFGRQYDIRPIAGINIRGNASDYERTDKVSKGIYRIRMKVENQAASFDVYLTVGKDGSASASVNSLRIDNARYTGYVVPIGSEVHVPLQEENREI